MKVHVTSKQKIKSAFFFPISPMNRYLNPSAVWKFAKTQNEQSEAKESNATHN